MYYISFSILEVKCVSRNLKYDFIVKKCAAPSWQNITEKCAAPSWQNITEKVREEIDLYQSVLINLTIRVHIQKKNYEKIIKKHISFYYGFPDVSIHD